MGQSRKGNDEVNHLLISRKVACKRDAECHGIFNSMTVPQSKSRSLAEKGWK